jgi:hypothetical protein
MRRRSFLQRLGLGTSGLLLSKTVKSRGLNYSLSDDFNIENVEDLLSQEGEVILRINYSSESNQEIQKHSGKIKVAGGKLLRSKNYFFHDEFDNFDSEIPGMKIASDQGHVDVVVLWIKEAKNETTIRFPVGKSKHQCTIREIIKEKDIEINYEGAQATISFLLDKEIGEVDPSDIGVLDDPENFSFTVMADPQGGNPFSHETVATRMRIHNAFIDESVRVVNKLDPQPLFNLVVGDIVDGQGHQDDFRAMNDMLEHVKIPTFYELGNHETKYKSVFTPGYNMDAFKNYFAAQKEFNGMDKLLYSFNLGRWHFIVWPDPLRAKFWELHPHYFDWLEQDLEKYQDRPTFFFQHVPMHPIGINPLINYAESVDVKRTLLDILTKHGNVKYILSGHVHIPMKAAVKTAVEYKGIKMINLPAAGYRPRAFGEEDYNGGPTQGVAIVDIKGEEAGIHFKSVVNEMFTFPDPPKFSPEKFPLWLNHKWELAEKERLQNGNFVDGLDHWNQRYVYTEDVHPSNICEGRFDEYGNSYLYLFCKPRGYHIPGQDRLPQAINRICQVIKNPKRKMPIIKILHWLDPTNYKAYGLAGTYIWIEGFEQGLKRLNIVYSTDHIFWNLGGSQSQIRKVLPVHMEITKPAGEWRNLILNPVEDFKRHTEMRESYPDRLDTFSISLGVWTINEGKGNTIGAGYTDIDISLMDSSSSSSIISMIGEEEIAPKEQKYMWWKGTDHVAGEHMNITEDLNRYLR